MYVYYDAHKLRVLRVHREDVSDVHCEWAVKYTECLSLYIQGLSGLTPVPRVVYGLAKVLFMAKLICQFTNDNLISAQQVCAPEPQSGPCFR
jgi:hypothetical protein